jgi:hypothetical protein
VHARVGLDVHEFATGVADRYDPVFSLEYRYNYSSTTQLQLDLYRREENSIVALNQNYILTGAALSFTEGVFERLHFGFSAGVNHSDYYATAPNLSRQTAYNYLFLRPALSCQMGSFTTGELYYQYQENWASPVNDFENNIFGVDIGVRF